MKQDDRMKLENQKKCSRIAKLFMLMLLLFSFVVATGKEQSPRPEHDDYAADFSKLEQEYGARLGVYAFDMETNREISYQADERFAYCSSFKVLAVGALLQQNSSEQLDQRVQYTDAEILSYAPVTKQHIATGMSIRELCEASLRYSDNTAANLVVKEIGGVQSLQRTLDALGDKVTEPAGMEPELNERLPGDNRDTSTPRQLAADLQAYTTGDVLPADKKALLLSWMTGNATGKSLIRAGAPEDWIVADKSGSGPYARRNDIAVVLRPDKKPMFIAILSMHTRQEDKYEDALLAQAAKIVFSALAGE